MKQQLNVFNLEWQEDLKIAMDFSSKIKKPSESIDCARLF